MSINKGKRGAPYKYEPEELQDKINKYFKFVDSSPIEKRKTETHKGEVKEYIEYIKRPYTIEGLCNYLDITMKTFYNWEDCKDLIHIITRARQIIRENKLSGSIAGIFNANIVIRDLSLRDTDTPQVINNIIPLNSSEVQAIAQSLSAEYGSLPTKEVKTIDITPED